MSVIEASEFLGVSPRMVYQLAAPNGPIPCYRIGKRIVFDAKDVQDYKANCRFEHVPLPPLRLRINAARNQRPLGASSLEETFKRLGLKVSVGKKRG
ncbi:helix-turn-helix domain-containing protein [Rhodoferax mekongensis]|uniref:helix-turn-helix domain-containing protein n=1 Tax=Rhodoferax mekongensis TaxID=3068341 RepID=UPI003D180D9A